jgi:hypothetical protein
MVNWKDAWTREKDANGIQYAKWVKRVDFEYVECLLCIKKFKYSTTGIQALKQHSSKAGHKRISDERFSETERHLSSAVSTSSSAPQSMMLDLGTGP